MKAQSLIAALLLAAPLASLAQASAPAQLPLWEIGAVGLVMSQQAYPGSSQRVGRGLALPYLIYRGKYLRADRESLGIRAINTPTLELDVGFAAAFGSSAEEIDARRGMPDLGTLVEFGPRLKWHLGSGPANGRLRAEFALRGVFDLDHQLHYRGMSFEPRLIYDLRGIGGWHYSTSVGAVVGNRRLGEHFYGVAPAYATASRPAYQADSGLIAWRLGATAAHDLTPNLRLYGFARIDSVAGGANRASPLVQKTTGPSVGLALTYTFARSSTLVSD